MAESRAFELTQGAREKYGVAGVAGSITLDQEGGVLRIGERLAGADGFLVTSHEGAIDFFSRDELFKATSQAQANAAGALDHEALNAELRRYGLAIEPDLEAEHWETGAEKQARLDKAAAAEQARLEAERVKEEERREEAAAAGRANAEAVAAEQARLDAQAQADAAKRWETGEAVAAAQELKGDELEEALKERGLEKTGNADEKRARVAEHDAKARIAEHVEHDANADQGGSQ